MKNLFYLSFLMMMYGCDQHQKPVNRITNNRLRTIKDTAQIQYTDQELETYLDSIGRLPVQPLARSAAFYADSVFKGQKQLDTLVSERDFETLKHAAQRGVMEVKIARRIFGNKNISFNCTTKSMSLVYKKGLIPVVYYPFDNHKGEFNEFAICIGDPGHCPNAYLYFFKHNKMISVHDGYARFSQEPEHYKDVDGKTIVYTVQQFVEGSGLGWFNYFFYKYDGDKLIPILNELENGNAQGSWNGRVTWLESTVIKTNPLTIKMVYYNQFMDRGSDNKVSGFDLLSDSTTVQYAWDERSKTLCGQYDRSKISKAQILSYNLEYNDLLFINTHYRLLKNALHNKTQRRLLLVYLNKVKDHSSKH